MSYREKSAWILLIVHAIVFGAYFAAQAMLWDQTGQGGASIPLLFLAVVALVIIFVILHIAAAIAAPKEASAAADEREQMIDLRAERIASYVLSACVVCCIGALLADWSGFLIANLLLAAMVLSAFAKAITQITLFRIGDPLA